MASARHSLVVLRRLQPSARPVIQRAAGRGLSSWGAGVVPALGRIQTSALEQRRCFSVGVTMECPALGGESISEGTLMEWKKKVGESVKKGEVIGMIETDKVTVDITATADGTITKLLVNADDTITVGQPMVELQAGGAPAAAASAPVAKPQASAAPAAAAPAAAGPVITMECPALGGESISEGTLMEWKKSAGDFATKGEIIGLIETDKVTVEIAATTSGTVKELLVKVDDTINVGQPLVAIQSGDAPAEGAAAAADASAAAPVAPPASVKKLKGLAATFEHLREVRAAQKAGKPLPGKPGESPAPTPAPAKTAPLQAASSIGRGERHVPMSVIRSVAIRNMKATQNTAALLSTFQEADLTSVTALRAKHKDTFAKKHGVPLGLLSLFAKAASDSLMEIPEINGIISDQTKEIVYRDYVDLSVPVPTPRGPVNCVLRNVESMSVVDIEKMIADLIAKGRANALEVGEISGGTFGISDSGSAGGMLGTCMIQPNTSAILGTNEVKLRPVAVNGKVEARPVMQLALTYDHRLVDGKEAVTFLCSIRDKMEDPYRLLLNL